MFNLLFFDLESRSASDLQKEIINESISVKNFSINTPTLPKEKEILSSSKDENDKNRNQKEKEKTKLRECCSIF